MLANITDQETVTLLEVPDMDKDDNTGAVTVRIKVCWYHRFYAKPYSIPSIPSKCQRVCVCVRAKGLFSAPAALVAACQRLVRRCLQPRVEKKAFVLSCRH